MDPLVLLVILFISLLTVAFFSWFFIHRSKERERLLLLEKGIHPSELPYRSGFHFPWLKIGCVITSATIGLILGILLVDVLEGSPIVGMILFGGIGLVIAHYVDKPNEQ